MSATSGTLMVTPFAWVHYLGRIRITKPTLGYEPRLLLNLKLFLRTGGHGGPPLQLLPWIKFTMPTLGYEPILLLNLK